MSNYFFFYIKICTITYKFYMYSFQNNNNEATTLQKILICYYKASKIFM